MKEMIAYLKSVAKRGFAAAALLLLLVMTTGCIPREVVLRTLNYSRFDQERQSSQDIPYTGQRILVSNFVGKITVEGVDLPAFVAGRQRVSVEWRERVRNLPLDELEVNISSDDEVIAIRSNAPDTIGMKLRWLPPFIEERVGLIEFTIRVPKEADLQLIQVAGVIEVFNFAGNLDISQSTGVRLESELDTAAIVVRDSALKELSISGQASNVALQKSTFRTATITSTTGGLYFEADAPQSVHVSASSDFKEIELIGEESFPGILLDKETAWPGQTLSLLIGRGDAQLSMSTQFGKIKIELLPR